jgi:hypothetical protein
VCLCVFVFVCVFCAMHGGVFFAQLRATLGMMREVCMCNCVCVCFVCYAWWCYYCAASCTVGHDA